MCVYMHIYIYNAYIHLCVHELVFGCKWRLQSLYMAVCMNFCTIFTYVCRFRVLQRCIPIFTHVERYIHACIRTHKVELRHSHIPKTCATHTCMYIYIYIYMRVCTYTYIRTYIHTYIHTVWSSDTVALQKTCVIHTYIHTYSVELRHSCIQKTSAACF